LRNSVNTTAAATLHTLSSEKFYDVGRSVIINGVRGRKKQKGKESSSIRFPPASVLNIFGCTPYVGSRWLCFVYTRKRAHDPPAPIDEETSGRTRGKKV
jgi:hypothetical protein